MIISAVRCRLKHITGTEAQDESWNAGEIKLFSAAGYTVEGDWIELLHVLKNFRTLISVVGTARGKTAPPSRR